MAQVRFLPLEINFGWVNEGKYILKLDNKSLVAPIVLKKYTII